MTKRLRFPLLCAAFAALSLSVALPPAVATSKSSSRAGAALTKVKLSACVSAANYADRRLTIRSSMKSIGAGGKMQMRLLVQRRYFEQKLFHVVTPSDTIPDALAGWLENTNPSATTFVYNFSVVPVETRAQYRAKLYYRWLDAGCKVVKRQRRTSSVCTQTRKLPELSPATHRQYANAGPVFPQMPAIHTLTVKNTGGSSAASFTVTGDINGISLLSEPVTTPTVFDFVPAATSIDFVLYGPECRTGDKITFVINATRSVREKRYDDDTFSEPCTG